MHVEGTGRGVRAFRTQFRNCLLDIRTLPRYQEDARARLRHRVRNTQSDTFAASSHDGESAIEAEVVICILHV